MSDLESAVGVRRTQPRRYTAKSVERIDSPAAPRLAMRITVPPGLARDELELNVRLAMLDGYEHSRDKLGAVTVFAYLDEGGEVDTTGPYTAAMGEFVPYGEWIKANPSTPLRDWKL